MKNGSAISQVIQDLKKIDRNWESCLLRKKEEVSREVLTLAGRLGRLLRQELKQEDKEEVQKFLLSENLQEQTVEKLVQATNSALKCYYDLSLLRELESKDVATVKGLMSIIYQKYVVRYEPGYLSHMSSAGGYDEERIKTIAEWMDWLTDYYISRSYTLQAVVRDMQDETGLSLESCEYWANLIEHDYTLLKTNYMIEGLDWIKNNLKES